MADNDIYDPYEESEDVAFRKTINEKQEDLGLYRIYEGSRVAISSAVGKRWKRIFDAACATYAPIWDNWEEAFRYYNNIQGGSAIQTPFGPFKRGDGTENIVYTNINVLLPAVYSKDPSVTCSTTDEGDKDFTRAQQTLINTLFKRKDALNAKPKIKKGVGLGLLTNSGVLKLDFTKRDDSRELAAAQLESLTQALRVAKTQEEADEIYGRLQALEENMEVRQPKGPGLGNVLPHNLLVDPYAEQPDGLDGNWMLEKTFLPTGMLIARFTKPAEGKGYSKSDWCAEDNMLLYKPTHRAAFKQGALNSREDGVGLLLREYNEGSGIPTSHTTDERRSYIDMFYTECYYVWDKVMRRVMLFHRDDWTWPIWVWNDPLQISRFFPYFIISYGMSTGGTTSVGEVSYYLDQQDEINDINRQVSKMRRTVFDYWFYNKDKVDKDEAEKFIDALRGKRIGGKNMIGISVGENGKVSDAIECVVPPSAHVKELFDKQGLLDTVNRITNTSDALRGVQFKTNTNVHAVDTYQQSMRLMVGAKVDVVEDVVADLAQALGELCVMNYSEEEVIGIIGAGLAKGWRSMGLDEYRSQYSVEVVAGSMEKPNSTFKKQEAVQIAQAIGQFAQAAPGTTLRVMLKVMEQAFTEVVISPEDWEAMDAEISANATKGVSTDQSGGGAPQGDQQLIERLKQLPPEVQQKVVQMKQQGMPDEQIKAFLMQALQQGQQNQPVQAANGAQNA